MSIFEKRPQKELWEDVRDESEKSTKSTIFPSLLITYINELKTASFKGYCGTHAWYHVALLEVQLLRRGANNDRHIKISSSPPVKFDDQHVFLSFPEDTTQD